MEEHRAHDSGAHLPPGAPRREIFDPEELGAVLSRYDLGRIYTVRELPRGSKRSPKVVIKADRGVFVLKRRALGRDDERRVAFCHAVQRHLASRAFPLARLVPDRAGETILRFAGRIYELFEFIAGVGFDASPELTHAAGRELAILHTLTADFPLDLRPPASGYHNVEKILAHLDAIPARVATAGHTDPADLASSIAALRNSYTEAAARAGDLGLADWPEQVVHGDWHPGNMVFHPAPAPGAPSPPGPPAAPGVAAVIDFDATRVEPRVLDLANGALQFSITRHGDDPGLWPESLDETRFRSFCEGYDGVKGCTISVAEIKATPWLMIEALIVEAAVPIAATGSFARMEGGAFVRMVERKVRWLEQNAGRLVQLISG